MIDYLIVGQGIAGSILAYNLVKAGKDVRIVDNNPPALLQKATQRLASSDSKLLKYSDSLYPKLKKLLGDAFKPKVIGGLITPVTGKRFTKTWLADVLLPFSKDFYQDLQAELKSAFYKPTAIVRIFADARQANDWDVRCADQAYSKLIDNDYPFYNDQLHYPHGFAVFKAGAVVDGARLVSDLHHFFKMKSVFKEDVFDPQSIIIKADALQWKNISTRNLIFCEGWQAINNPYFEELPFMPAKGELLIIKAGDLKLKEVINRGIFIRPLGQDLYLSGSTYTWDDLSLEPTEQARNEISSKLGAILKTDFTIVEQLAGIRPTVKGRRPFIGQHPQYKNIFIFNGLGTKGLLLAPFFARQLTDHLLQATPLTAEVNIARYYNT